jgi:hypothetical protein
MFSRKTEQKVEMRDVYMEEVQFVSSLQKKPWCWFHNIFCRVWVNGMKMDNIFGICF